MTYSQVKNCIKFIIDLNNDKILVRDKFGSFAMLEQLFPKEVMGRFYKEQEWKPTTFNPCWYLTFDKIHGYDTKAKHKKIYDFFSKELGIQ